ncbi:hypothetical protein ID853_02215 [Xenorhabdus sp. Vera]|nr:hypothetical protein [Xenorhabdus sp. Vera]MBD2809729.1 hypothetical protein [Xenorhabdus sp. Vera]
MNQSRFNPAEWQDIFKQQKISSLTVSQLYPQEVLLKQYGIALSRQTQSD